MTDSWEALVHAHRRELHGMLAAITRNWATAEDLTQEVFMVAVKKQIQPGEGARAWLRAVAWRLAMNELRKKRAEPMAMADLEMIASNDAVASAARTVDSFDEELAALRECMNALSDAQRETLAARYERQEPLTSIATCAGQTVGYVKQRLFRLRQRLAKCIQLRMAQSGAINV